ncbi:3-hydroxyacyl-ACP dehydratase FabZ family protein [Streptomyces sp. NPDC002669]|uniref:3-hydroxyacyl-ACP dehydratase FabZ family protein n=1 Tax=Streptomyces sp. NPDC002669 TaxID=3364658 RepID=UPI0036996B46
MSEMRKFSAPLEAIDGIVRINESGITATKTVRTGDPYLEGHYPDFTIYPGVFIMESVNQAVDAYAARVLGTDRIADLVTVMSARFTSPVLPGDTLQVTCQVTVHGDDLGVEANCRTAAGTAAARLKLMYRITGGDTR